MLTYKLLKNHAGLLLTGDYQTLRALHEVIHDVNERSPLIKYKDGPFLGLAYDLRKAYEGQRKTLKPPEGYPEIGPRFGVEVVWPALLWQCRALRASMAFIDTTKNMQAHAYALESVIEEGVLEDFGGDLGASVIAEWERINPAHPYSEEALASRGAVFCSWTKNQRKKGIVGLVGSFNPMYSALYPIWLGNGATNLVPPEEYEKWSAVEWPDPKW